MTTKRTPEEVALAWQKTPELVKTYIRKVLERDATELERIGAERTFSQLLVTHRLAESMQQSTAGMGAGAEIAVAATASAMAAMGGGEPPEKILADFVRVAIDVLDATGGGPPLDPPPAGT